MKSTKKFIISLAFLSPVVLLTPTLLASCSYIPIDKIPDSGNVEKPVTPPGDKPVVPPVTPPVDEPVAPPVTPPVDQNPPEVETPVIPESELNRIADWEVLKANDTYVQKDGDSKTTPVYLFKSGTTKDVYSIKDASDSMKKLVTNSIYAGNVLDAKTKRASETIGSDFEKVTSSDLTKSTYVKRNFNLSNKDNFNLVNQLISKQKFTNVYSNGDNQTEGNTYLGESIWFGDDKFEFVNKILKCDVYVSLAETGNKSENIQYTIKFSFTIKSKQNWPNKNDNHPIEFEIQFETRNFLSLFKEHDINALKNLPKYTLMSSIPIIPFYAGNLSKKSLINSQWVNLDATINYFANKGTQAIRYPGTYLTLLDKQINAAKVSQTFSKLNAPKIINTDHIVNDTTSAKEFYISKDKSSLPYILGTDNSTISTNEPVFTNNDGAYIDRMDVVNVAGTHEFIYFKMKHRSKNYKWFWGNWDEISNPYNPSKNASGFSDFEIWFKMRIVD